MNPSSERRGVESSRLKETCCGILSPHSSHCSSRPAARRPPLAASCSRRVPVKDLLLMGS
jgi:hypothetical protein